jgi:predicted transcriptional regulator of viral defense system
MARISPNLVENTLIKLNISIFSIKEFTQIFNVKPATARAFLARNSKKEGSHILNLEKGIYIFSINPPTKFEIANKLYQPSYISFETALSYYGIIPETVYSITSATTKKSREMSAQNSNFRYYKIKKNLFFGYRPQKFNNKIIVMAEAEKALLDYVYILSLKKGIFNSRLDLNRINKKKLAHYVKYFKKSVRKNKAFISLINKIYKPL